MLTEARRLYQLGFALHWIKPNSKAPVKSKWTTGPREDWKQLKASYREGYGLGVRMGSVSAVNGYALANIDIDVKSDDPKHHAQALKKLEKLFPGLYQVAPIVKTGYGLRLFVLTKGDVSVNTLTRSKEQTVVHMPNSEVNRKQIKFMEDGLITQKQLDEGYRVRPAWELELMSAGKQVVLPPSIHPDTKKPYTWQRPVNLAEDIPFIDVQSLVPLVSPKAEVDRSEFKPVNIDIEYSRLKPEMIDMIMKGDGAEDRSAACLSAAMAMFRIGYTDVEVLSVLSNRDYYLGDTAYEHRKTKSRSAAVQWLKEHTLPKAKKETSLSKIFSDQIAVTPFLSDDEVKAATEKLSLKGHGDNWLFKIKRFKPKDGETEGAPRPLVENIVLILRNAISPEIFKRDLFLSRDTYGCEAPWTGGTKGRMIEDDDIVHISLYLSKYWKFEPAEKKIYNAVIAIASENAYHPVRDELEALPDWDGVARIDTAFKTYFEAKGDDEYLAQVFRKWLVASITRTYHPGTKFDWIILIEGDQGTGKSSFGSILFGQKYFTDWLPDLSDKDAALGLVGNRCIEFGELDQLRRTQLDATKAFITRQVDKVRPPFGRLSVEIYRQCVFFGTTNRKNYLQDDSGNRRFNPVVVGRLDWESLERDRDQIWAEALFIYRNGLERHLYLEGEAIKHATDIQNEKMVSDGSDFMYHEFEKFIESERHKTPPEKFHFHDFKLAELFDSSTGVFREYTKTRANEMLASTVLRKFGAQKHRKMTGIHWSYMPDTM